MEKTSTKIKNGLTLKYLNLTQSQARFLTAILLVIEVKGFVIPSLSSGPDVAFSSPNLSHAQTKLITYIGTTVGYKMALIG